MAELVIHYGVPDAQRDAAARLYEAAFGRKLARAIGRKPRRIALIAHALQPDYAICALQDDELVGLLGYHTADGSLTGGLTGRQLLRHLGWVRGTWAALVLSLLERKRAPGVLLLDGIAVRDDMRGRGIGTRLLAHAAQFAASHDYTCVRLDVIDTNPRARQLYERVGYRVVRTERFPYLRWFLGFGASTTMELRIDPESAAPPR